LRFAYLNRARLKKSTRIGGRRLAALRGQVYNLVVELKDADQLKDPDLNAACANVPVLLRRPDDPDWRYREPQRTQDAAWLLVTGEDGRLRLSRLGAGRYLLRVDGFKWKGKAHEWLRVTMDQDRELTFTGAVQ
jgi:hypothetical protein